MSARRITPMRSLENTRVQRETFVPVADVDHVVDDYDAEALAVGTLLTLAATVLPNTGRNLTYALGNAGTSTGSYVLEAFGYDIHDQPITEQATVSKAIGTVVGSKIFKRIVYVKPVEQVSVGVANDLINVGIGDRIGMLFAPADLAVDPVTGLARVIIERVNSTTRAVVATSSSTVDLENRALKAIGSGGSGALGSGDTFTVTYRLRPDDPDDRDFQAAGA